jgi:hypothetical protein
MGGESHLNVYLGRIIPSIISEFKLSVHILVAYKE